MKIAELRFWIYAEQQMGANIKIINSEQKIYTVIHMSAMFYLSV
jgi:hypothetical protein